MKASISKKVALLLTIILVAFSACSSNSSINGNGDNTETDQIIDMDYLDKDEVLPDHDEQLNRDVDIIERRDEFIHDQNEMSEQDDVTVDLYKNMDEDTSEDLDKYIHDSDKTEFPDSDSSDLCAGGALDKAEWKNLGTLSKNMTEGAIAVVGDNVFIGTTDGVWKNSISKNDGWKRSGLKGIIVNRLLAVENKIMAGTSSMISYLPPKIDPKRKTFYISADDGQSWTAHGDEFYSKSEKRHIDVYDLTYQPGGVIYANLSGLSVARSNDFGKTWKFVVGKALFYMNYSCYIHVSVGSPDKLYQGCEIPLDSAWVKEYDISDKNSETLGDGKYLVDIAQISNRRPNYITNSKANPDKILVGHEGALTWFENDNWGWIFRKDLSGTDPLLYTYVKAIWSDPCDENHLVFGGMLNSDIPTQANFYETFDNGQKTMFADIPASYPRAQIMAGVSTGEKGKDFIIVIKDPKDINKPELTVSMRIHSK